MKDKFKIAIRLIMPPFILTFIRQAMRARIPSIKKFKAFIMQTVPPICVIACRYFFKKEVKYINEKKYQPELGLSIIEKARQHFDSATSFPAMDNVLPQSTVWMAFVEKMRDKIKKFSSIEEVIFCCQREIGFDHRAKAAGIKDHLFLCEETLKSEFPHFSSEIERVSDSPYSLRDTLYEHQGRLLSNMIFFHVRYVLQCLTYVDKPKIVCEIGGGYGGPARLWLNNSIHSPNTYIIIDFPESLFFAEVFLRVNFDNLKLLYVTDSTPIDLSRASQYSVIFCPIACVDSLRKLRLDLVINTGSMQEMTDDWVDFWMGWLKKQDCHYFYSLNYFAQPLQYKGGESANDWCIRCPPDFKTKFQWTTPRFVRLQSPCNGAELLFEKQSVKPLMDRDSAMRLYQEKRSRILDNQVLLECFDIIRVYPDENIMWDLLQRCVSELLAIPKEAYYLAEYLSKHATVEFKMLNGKRLEDLRIKLISIRMNRKDVTEDVQIKGCI